MAGILYGVERSEWVLEGETDVDKTGLMFGVYGGNRGNSYFTSGLALATAYTNELTSETGATAEVDSQRILLSATASSYRGSETSQAGVIPYVSLMYTHEVLEPFTFSDGTSVEETTQSLGRISAGLEYATDQANGARFVIRGQLNGYFDIDEIVLSNGQTYRPGEDISGSLTLGWAFDPNEDSNSTARADITLSGIGDETIEEVRTDFSWIREF